MSIEYNNFDSNNQPLTSIQRDMLNHAKIDVLKSNDRANFDLAGLEAGTTFIMETDDGRVEFSVYPTGLAEEIKPNEAVYAQIRNTEDGPISYSEILIFGASEELTMITSKLGTIEQFADFVYAPLIREPLWQEDFELSDEDFQKKIQLGDIISTSIGSLRLVQDEARVLAVVLDLAIKDSEEVYDIFVYDE